MSPSAHKVVVLLSGGLDSTANLALAHDAGDEIVLAITADYGQRAAPAEIRAARRLCQEYGVREHRVLDLKWLGALGGSALTDSALSMPHVERSKLDDRKTTETSARAVWVPNRNGVLINMAAALAERVGAHAVLVGFNREEAATFPDNSLAYLDAATAALAYSTANGVRVESWTTALDKREIVAKLRRLRHPFRFDLLWSCYEDGQKEGQGDGQKACGECESCQRLKRALGEA